MVCLSLSVHCPALHRAVHLPPAFNACMHTHTYTHTHTCTSLPRFCSTRTGGFLSAGTNFRLFQLFNSVLILLFTTSSIIQIAERMPFHQALYLVRQGCGGKAAAGPRRGGAGPSNCCLPPLLSLSPSPLSPLPCLPACRL